MPRKSTTFPELKTEAEEAGWYATPQGRRETQRQFARALKDGTLVRSSGLKIPKTDPKVLRTSWNRPSGTRRAPSRSASPSPISKQAQQIAEKTGVGYQTVLKQAIRKGLKRAG